MHKPATDVDTWVTHQRRGVRVWVVPHDHLQFISDVLRVVAAAPKGIEEPVGLLDRSGPGWGQPIRAGGQVALQLPCGRVRPAQIPHLRANRFGEIGISLQSFEKTGAPPDSAATFARHGHLDVPFPTQRPRA